MHAPAPPAARRPERPRRRWFSRREEVVVADVEVAGRVQLRAEAPHIIQIQPGQRLRLVCPYRFITRSRTHEDFDARLQVSLEGEEGAQKDSRVDEGMMRHRRTKGRLHQDLVFPLPGTHIVRWSVEVDYGVRAWGSGQPLAIGHEEAGGLLRIEVLRSAG